MLNLEDIKEIIPHRYPFILIDRVLEINEEEKKIVGIKNVSGNEPFFQGHFPEKPIMPGVLIAESLAQIGAVYVKRLDNFKDKIMVLAGLNNFKFKKPVYPGDQMRLEMNFITIKKNIGKGHGKAFVGDELVCEGDIVFAAVQE